MFELFWVCPALFLWNGNIHGSALTNRHSKGLWEGRERIWGQMIPHILPGAAGSLSLMPWKWLSNHYTSTSLSILNCWKWYFLSEGSDHSYSHPSNKQRWLFCYHEYAERPPVGTLRVSPAVDHLWRHILYCPTEWIRSLVMVDGFFTQTKI